MSWRDKTRSVYDNLDESIYIGDQETSDNIDFITKLFPINKNTNLIDVGCGKGRLLFPLDSKGYRVYGIDIHEKSISKINSQLKKIKSKSSAENQDFCELKLDKNIYDGAFMIYGTFGVMDDSQIIRFLSELRGSVKPRGRIIIDLLNLGRTVATAQRISDLGNKYKHIIGDHYSSAVRSREVDENNIEITTYNIIGKGKDKNKRKIQYKQRLFSLSEISELLNRANLIVEDVSGDYKMSEYKKNSSPRMIIIAKKGEEE